MTDSGYLVSRSGVAVYVRATGLANMANTPVLEAFLTEELALGVQVVCIDLSECIGMDSTFMGTLVAFHHRLQAQNGRFMVVNPSNGNRRLLDKLGVSAVLPVLGEHSVPDLQFVRLRNDGPMSAVERAHL
ncbi:MAG: anti-sigma factor antagonist, partial [Planctomycetota bacterium]